MPTIAALSNYPLYTGDTTGFHIIANDNEETTTYKIHKDTLLSGLATTGSNTFVGTETVTGSVNVSNTVSALTGSFSNVIVNGQPTTYGVANLTTGVVAIQSTATGTMNATVGKVTLSNSYSQVVGASSPGTTIFTLPTLQPGTYLITAQAKVNGGYSAMGIFTGGSQVANTSVFNWYQASGTVNNGLQGTWVLTVTTPTVYTINAWGGGTVSAGSDGTAVANYIQINPTFALTAISGLTTTGNMSVGGNLTVTGSINVVSGSITMPERPAFRVYGLGGATSATTTLSGSMTIVDFNQGNAWNNSNGTFTAPIAGLYQVNLVCRTNSNSSPSGQIIVYKNHTGLGAGTAQIMVEWAANTTMNHAGGSTISKLAVGDTLKAIVSVGTLSFDANDNFSVAYIG
jgi:hypothetical protein